MQSAKSIMLEKLRLCSIRISAFLFFTFLVSTSFAQSNSPYSRYGFGDATPSGNTISRGMGGVSAAFVDNYASSVNFSNPASYSKFLAIQEQRSKKLASGRVVLDVGINLGSRTLIAPNTPDKFTSSDLIFSYVQVGIPLRKNWGMAFGIRPLSRVGYMINATDSLKDSFGNTLLIHSQHRGSGGSYLPTIGTGFAIKNFSAGFNFGYLFGNRENTLLKQPLDDSLQYYPSEHTTFTSFGNVFFDAGIQYQMTINKTTLLRLGVAGNWKQTLNATQNRKIQTYTLGTAGEELRIDSVYEKNGVKGELIYPSSYKAGIMLQRDNTNGSGWLFGIDYTTSKWSEYRFYGQQDSVQDSKTVNFGMQFRPRPRSNYFSAVAYRFGFFTGRDYIKVKDDLPIFGASFGMALPVRSSRYAPNQATIFNLGLEYIKRGNDNNLLKENIFRFSLGLNLSDFWFGKKKYE